MFILNIFRLILDNFNKIFSSEIIRELSMWYNHIIISCIVINSNILLLKRHSNDRFKLIYIVIK